MRCAGWCFSDNSGARAARDERAVSRVSVPSVRVCASSKRVVSHVAAHEPVAACDAARPARQTSLCTTRAPGVALRARAPAVEFLLQVELPRSHDVCFREQLWMPLPTLALTLVRCCPLSSRLRSHLVVALTPTLTPTRCIMWRSRRCNGGRTTWRTRRCYPRSFSRSTNG